MWPLLVVAGAGYLFVRSMVDAQHKRNDLLKTEIKVLDKRIEEINSLEAKKQQFIARMQIIEKLQRSRPEIVHVFDTFVTTLPDGTYLTGVKQTDRRFRITGVAQSSTRVSAFMRNLDSSQWLRNPELEVVLSAKDNPLGSEFILFADQVTTLTEENPDEAAAAGAPPVARAQ